MFDRASKKLGLEQAVLGTFGQEDDDDKPTSKEMEQLLKKGAYALLEDENDEITKAFCADDIDSILAKRTRTRVVEGTKTASWLNKQGMVVSKSKFTSDSKAAAIDVDDPLFWQKVMPDFVTPAIMLQKLQDLTDEINGTTGKTKGRGRGRWRSKQKETSPAVDEENPEDGKSSVGEGDTKEPAVTPEDDANEAEGDAPVSDSGDKNEEDGDGDDDEKEEKFQLTRTNQRKIAKFMSDLKSMMEGLIEDADDDGPPAEDKATAQKLLLTISVKERLFNEEQRHFARVMLKRLEGNRRRRCRTSDQQARVGPGRRQREDDGVGGELREELLIVGKKKRKRRKKAEIEAESERKKRKRSSDDESGAEVGDDGYLVHSDDEADWSDIGEDLYKTGKKRPGISRKEARRRRQWAADDDPATAAGRAWPVFPRHVVNKVLASVLEEVMKHDSAKGGVFSVPVPRDEFPEYYEQIKHPMDYGTMKEKLENGEYRSAQSMQKDFVLVMHNCIKFNAQDSEIVQEARHQALMRPNILRNAALKHDLFLAEDGSVLEVYDDDGKKKGEENSSGTPKKRRRRKKSELVSPKSDEAPIPRKVGYHLNLCEIFCKEAFQAYLLSISLLDQKKWGKKNSKKGGAPETPGPEDEDDDVPLTSLRKKKPRIRISLGDGEASKASKKRSAKRSRSEDSDDMDNDDDDTNAGVEVTPIPRKKKRKATSASKADSKAEVDGSEKRRGKKKGKSSDSQIEKDYIESDDDVGSRSKISGETRNGSLGTDSKRGFASVNNENGGSNDPDVAPGAIYLDAPALKKEREALDDNFKASRDHFRKRGPWTLPSPLAPGKFRDVAMATLNKMGR